MQYLKFNLENEGLEVDVAYSGEEALEKLSESHSLIILDVMMEGMSGFKMAEELRKEENTVPIIFLTAKMPKTICLKGFVGGDDYVTKPFSVKRSAGKGKSRFKTYNDVTNPVHEMGVRGFGYRYCFAPGYDKKTKRCR